MSPMPTPRHDPGKELRILHWNIHSWRDGTGRSNEDAVVNVALQTDPHILSLVEVDENWNRPSTLEQLADRMGYASIFVPTFEFSANSRSPVGGFGNALLSRLPIRAIRQRQLLWPPRVYDGTEPSEPRSVALAKLDMAGHPLWVGSTHLPRHHQAARLDAMSRLATIVDELEEQWLLVGDFNTPASSWVDGHRILRPYPASPEPTYPAPDPVEAIDYCIAPPGLRIHVEVLKAVGSDHLPILLRCTMKPPT
jgi:endonuclease/exonuclease/phosphatase family metal-dependent hydrolase